MRDIEYRLALRCALHRFVQLVLRDRIQRTGRLIHDQDIRIFIKGSGDRNFLALTTGEIDALFVKFRRHLGIQAFFQFAQAFFKSGPFQCIRDRRILQLVRAVHDHVFLQAGTVHLIILKYHPDVAVIIVRLKLPDILSMITDLSAGRIVQTHQQFDQRRFARTVITDDSDLFTRLHFQRDILQRLFHILFVLKAQMLQIQFCISLRQQLTLTCLDLWIILQERTDLIHIQAVFLHLWENVCQIRHTAPQAAGTVKEHYGITVINGMQHRCLEHQIGDIQTVDDEIAYRIIFEKSEH